jgi:hypothetical protein
VRSWAEKHEAGVGSVREEGNEWNGFRNQKKKEKKRGVRHPFDRF